MQLKFNPILDTDSYKYSHYRQYPPGTTVINSYIESRGGDYDEQVFFGLQAFVKAYLTQPMTQFDVEEAEAIVTAHGLPFNRAGFERIVDVWEGYWPVRITAIPEGTVLGPRNALVQVTNLDPELPWVTAFIETALLRAVWYPMTVATRSRKIKRIIKRYLDRTADDTAGALPFKLHDFGARGVSSRESSYIGGMGHLVNFMGTDTIEAVRAARLYYGEQMAGVSIPAAEHSTITSWTRTREADAYRNMITQFGKPGGLVAVVSDSYDIYNAANNVWPSLKGEIDASGGTLVIRPDSGHPPAVVLALCEILTQRFGYTETKQGYKLLPQNIRLIQGDGINEDSVEEILDCITGQGYSADNVAFGMGGEMLQTMNRDTMKFAMKASAAVVNGEEIGVSKEPVGDASKKSKEGFLKVVELDAGDFMTVKRDDFQTRHYQDVLTPVFVAGEVLREQSFADIRSRAEVK